MAEEVKIVVRTEADIKALEATQAKIQDLYKAAAAYESKGFTDLAKSTRGDAKSLEKDLAREAKEHGAAQKAVTAEQREQVRLQREQSSVEKARSAAFRRVGGALGAGAAALAGTMLEDYLQREAIGIRVGNRAASDARGLSLRQTRGFSAGSALSAVQGTEDEIFERTQKRAELKQATKSEMIASGLKGAAGGASVGAALGSFVPGIGTAIGAGIGAVLGGSVGAYRGSLAGRRAEQENELDKERAKKRQPQEEADRKARYAAEGGSEIEAQKARIAGRYKEAITIDQTREAYQRYQQVLHATNGDETAAREAASLTLKQREIDVRRGLGALGGGSDSRGNLAALASIGQSFSTGGVEQRLDQLIHHVDAGYKQQGVRDTHTGLRR